MKSNLRRTIAGSTWRRVVAGGVFLSTAQSVLVVLVVLQDDGSGNGWNALGKALLFGSPGLPLAAVFSARVPSFVHPYVLAWLANAAFWAAVVSALLPPLRWAIRKRERKALPSTESPSDQV